MTHKGFLISLILVACLLVSCTPAPEGEEKIVTKVVEVEKEVTRIVAGTPVIEKVVETVVVEKEKVVEKPVVQTVVVEKPVVQTVVVEKIVEVEKAQPKYGGTLTIASWSLSNLDVNSGNRGYDMEKLQNVYETLFDRDDQGQVVGLLVREADVSADGLTHTWKLQPAVKFHDGSDFNAEAVKWNLERKLDLKQPLWDLVPIDKVEVVDPLTVKITLSRPCPALYATLAVKNFSMYSPSFVQKVGDEGIKGEASGTGPFMVGEFVPNEVLRLEKNPDYWQTGLPYLEAIVYKVVDDLNARTIMLEAGDVDIAMGISYVDIERLKKDARFTILEGLSSEQRYITMHNRKLPLDDVRVRRAINYAVDKEGMIEHLFLGHYAQLARAVYVNHTLEGYSEAGVYDYDPDQARELLETAGWVDTDGDGIREKDDKKLSLDFYAQQGANPADLEIIELVQGMLKEVGVEVKVTFLDRAAYRDAITKVPEEAPYHLALLGVGTYTGDAEYTMITFYACDSASPRYYNRAYFCDEEVDNLIEKSKTMPTLEERNAIYADILKRVVDQAPVVQFFDILATVGMHSYVKGVYLDPAIINWPVKYAWLDK